MLFWHRATSALLSPHAGLTSEFGMESGGTPPLKTPPSFARYESFSELLRHFIPQAPHLVQLNSGLSS